MTINLANPPARTPSLSNPDTFEQDTSAYLAWMATIAGQIDGKVLEVDDILGTVSQSGGIPTGAIIERGSNSNGEYVRFADGTQICTRGVTVSEQVSVDYSYPASFLGPPAVYIGGGNGGLRPTGGSDFGPKYRAAVATVVSSGIGGGNWQISVDLATVGMDGLGGASAYDARLFAIGRWY